MSASGRFFYARPNREGEPEGAGPGCGNVRFVEGGGAILYGFKIFAAIYYPFGCRRAVRFSIVEGKGAEVGLLIEG